jgi:hypothetical protein
MNLKNAILITYIFFNKCNFTYMMSQRKYQLTLSISLQVATTMKRKKQEIWNVFFWEPVGHTRWVLPSKPNFLHTHEPGIKPLTTCLRRPSLLPLEPIHCWYLTGTSIPL